MKYLSEDELYTLYNLCLQGDLSIVKNHLAQYSHNVIINSLVRSIRSGGRVDINDYHNLLLTDGLDINIPSELGGDTLIYAATLKNNLWMVKDLLSKGADINALCVNGSYAVLAACSDPEKIELLDFLLNSGANPNLVTNAGDTSFTYCVKGKSPHSITKIIDAGADINFRDSNNSTPLQSALFVNKTDNILAVCQGAKDKAQIDEFRKQVDEKSYYENYEFVHGILNSIEVKMNLDSKLTSMDRKQKNPKI